MRAGGVYLHARLHAPVDPVEGSIAGERVLRQVVLDREARGLAAAILALHGDGVDHGAGVARFALRARSLHLVKIHANTGQLVEATLEAHIPALVITKGFVGVRDGLRGRVEAGERGGGYE